MLIDNLEVKGFRSLGDTKMPKLGPINILYGENNAGKSNILAALETLFQVENMEKLESPVGVFLKGELSNFVDNFTLSQNGEKASKINIKVRLLLDEKDLKQMPYFADFIRAMRFPEQKRKQRVYEQRHRQRIDIEVEIEPSKADKAIRRVESTSINDVIVYDPTKPESERFFGGLSAGAEERQKAAEQLFNYLMNCFGTIRAGRSLTEEPVIERQLQNVSAKNFKSWLLGLSQSRGAEYETFQEIARLFNEKPFEYGVVRPFVEGNSIGLVIKDNSNRELVIERYGTGVQQVLILLADIVCSKAKILGIEEIELNLSPSLQNRLLTMLKDLVGKNANGLMSQLILTSHSKHLGKREDVVLYAVERDVAGNTNVKWGAEAISQLPGHFDFGLMNLPGKKIWR